MEDASRNHNLNRDYFLQIAESLHRPFTAKEIAKIFVENENPMSASTIYRLLEEFSSSGILHKILGDNNTTRYIYLRPCSDENHLYLECERCHRIFHLDCTHLQRFKYHLAKKHSFIVLNHRLIIPGICAQCQEKEF